MRRLSLSLLALCVSLTAHAATVVSFTYADTDDRIALRNPHAVPVTVVLRAIGSTRAPMQLTIGPGETRTLEAPLAAVSFEQDGILAIESSDTLAGLASLPLAFASSPVRATVSNTSPLLVAAVGTVRVSVFESDASRTPVAVRTYTGEPERLLRLPLVSLLPFGSPLTSAVVSVEPLTGTAVLAVRPFSRRRAARPGPAIAAPVLTIEGSAACEFTTGVRARVAPLQGQAYAWTLRNASAASLSGSQVDLALGPAGYALVSVTATSPQGTATSDAYVRIDARPSVTNLTATSATQGEQVTISGETDGDSMTLSGTDMSSVAVQVRGGAFSYSYRAETTGQKTVRAVAQNICGTGERSANYTVGASCNTPNSSISAPSTAPANTVITASMSSGAGSYSWSVTGGTIVSGQGTPQISIQTGAPGQMRISGTASNGGGCESSDSATVTVTAPAPMVNSLTADDYVVPADGTTTLRFTIQNAASWSFSSSKGNGVTPRTGTGSGSFTTLYGRLYAVGADTITLTVTGTDGSTVQQSIVINSPPYILELQASPTTIQKGGSSTLSFNIGQAETWSLSSSLGNSFSPSSGTGSGNFTSTYSATSRSGQDTVTLSVTGPGGTTSRTVQIGISEPTAASLFKAMSANLTSIKVGQTSTVSFTMQGNV